jgi:hypothetical protein
VLDAIHFVATSWELVDFVFIPNFFRKVGFGPGNLEELTEDVEPVSSKTLENVQENLNFSCLSSD